MMTHSEAYWIEEFADQFGYNPIGDDDENDFKQAIQEAKIEG